MFGACLFALAVFASAPEKAKPPAPELALAEKIQRFYDKTNDLAADFEQTYSRVALSRTSESRGTVKIKKPGMMRWDYTKPVAKHFIADGKQLFIYEPEEEQVIIDPNFQTSQLTTSVSFLWGKKKLVEDFTIAMAKEQKRESEGLRVLDLTPRTDATYTKLTLVVNESTGSVSESILYETSGNTNHFRFKNIKTNSAIEAALFSFTPPSGVEIVRRP